VHVKEAAMHIDNLSMSDKYQVGFAGQILLVQGVSITHSMNNRSNDHLRARVAVSNTRHVKAALLWS
jgi:hypothetical protein